MKRVLILQDLSCFGKCSTTIALPVLSAAGIEACPLPVMLLSSHTAYPDPARLDTAGFARQTLDRWREQGVSFDAVYIGYLACARHIGLALSAIADFARPGTLVVVDPAMADGGKLYSGLTPEYAKGVAALAAKADILLPNVSEAAMLLQTGYPGEDISPERAAGLAKELLALGAGSVVLTGIADAPGRTGALFADGGQSGHCAGPKEPGKYHGTGDLFASVVTAAAVRGLPLARCVDIAVRFTRGAVARTAALGRDSRQGLAFEPGLPELATLTAV